MMISTGPKNNVVPLLFHAADEDGNPRTSYGGLLSLDDGTLLISNLSTGQSITVDITEATALTSLLETALNRYAQAHAPEVEEGVAEPAGEVVGEPLETAEVEYPDGREMSTGEDGVPLLEQAPRSEVPPGKIQRRPVRRVDE